MKDLIKNITKRLDRLIELSLDKFDGGASEKAYKTCKDIIQEEAKKYNNGWIPVKEKLPHCGSTILILLKNKSDGITMDDGATCDISWLRTEGYFISSQGKYKYEDVTAWQPLPAQPEGE